MNLLRRLSVQTEVPNYRVALTWVRSLQFSALAHKPGPPVGTLLYKGGMGNENGFRDLKESFPESRCWVRKWFCGPLSLPFHARLEE